MIPGDTAFIYSIEVTVLLVHLVFVGELLSLGCHDGSRLDGCVTHLV